MHKLQVVPLIVTNMPEICTLIVIFLLVTSLGDSIVSIQRVETHKVVQKRYNSRYIRRIMGSFHG